LPATAYPADSDVLQFLIDAGVIASGTASLPTSLTGIASAASAAWEGDTGYTPFYVASGTTATARLFDPPVSDRLFLEGGIVSTTGLIVSVSGSVQTLNTNYYVEPRNNTVRGVPIDTIRFTWIVTGVPQSISVTGLWGHNSDLPKDAWHAILKKAAMLSHEVIQEGAIKKETQGDVSYEYAVDASTSQLSNWANSYASTMSGYRQGRL
jgi:hypothetical protein